MEVIIKSRLSLFNLKVKLILQIKNKKIVLQHLNKVYHKINFNNKVQH